MPHDTAPLIRFTADSHDDAKRITALLDALGYNVTRVVPDEQWADNEADDRAIDRLKREFRLVTREELFATGVWNEVSEDELIAVQGSAVMLKWVSRSTYAKCCLEDDGTRGDPESLRALIRRLRDERGVLA